MARVRLDLPVLAIGLMFVVLAVALHFAWPTGSDPCGAIDVSSAAVLPDGCGDEPRRTASYIWPGLALLLALLVVAAGVLGRGQAGDDQPVAGGSVLGMGYDHPVRRVLRATFMDDYAPLVWKLLGASVVVMVAGFAVMGYVQETVGVVIVFIGFGVLLAARWVAET